MTTIAIIGGGFCGTMTAVNLARLSNQPLKIKLVNSKRPLGRGTAYGTKRGEHLLNVAARNMSALPDKPSHFVDWLRSRFEYAETPVDQLREMFAPRRVYGDYLRGLLSASMNPIDARSSVRIEAIEDEAVDVALDDSGSATVQLKDGDSFQADRIVLATGNQPPAPFPSPSPLRFDPRYRSDPWDEWISRLPPAGGTVVLLGSGLTMVDILLTLGDIGWEGNIVAISRSGRLPKSHFRGIAYDDYVPEDVESLGLHGLRKLIQFHCEKLKQMSQNSAIALDKLRPHTQKIWQSLTVEDREQFLRKDAAEWNVTRHRIAASIHNRVTDALDAGRLRVISGTIQELVAGEQQIEVILSDQEGMEFRQAGDLVINCTGPQLRFSKTASPLFRNLLERQLVQADEMDMGVRVDENFAALAPNSQTSGTLYAIGPLLRGSLWETTAVPELRVQAMRVTEKLLQREPTTMQETDVLEYYI
ncbi:MAG: FAD/NAD(P)-binding protein [Planctomycetota bacterium]